MARKTIAKYFSDLSGDEIDNDNPTVKFSLGGTNYEVDLTDDERAAMRAAFGPYIDAGRRATSQRKATTGPSAKDVRAWAVAQGLDVPARGRIPSSILDAFAAAH